MTFVSFVTLLFFIYIYRLSSVSISNLDDNKIYAPISGRVISIDSDGFKKEITIEVGFFDIHNLRSIEAGEVEVSHKRGINLPLGSLKAKMLNEKSTLKFKHTTLELYHATCNILNIENRQQVQKAENIGTFLKGEAVIKMDEKVQPLVTIGQKVESGETLIATIKKS